MNKKGFTLAEVLITLGIIGVIAALTLPGMISKKPSENKLKILKAYSALSSTVADLIDDETLYYPNSPAGCQGLECQGAPLIGDNFGINNGTSANEKLARLIASKMTKNGDIDGDGREFTTVDGSVWTFEIPNPNPNNAIVRVTIDVNQGDNDDNTNQTYDDLPADKSNINFVPDRFAFDIDRDGAVIPVGDFEKYIQRDASKINRGDIIRDIKTGAVED